MGIIWFGAERTISRYADDMLLYISDPTYLDTVSYVLNLGDGEFQTSPTSHSLSLSFSLNVYRHCRSTRMTIRLDVSAEATCLFFLALSLVLILIFIPPLSPSLLPLLFSRLITSEWHHHLLLSPLTSTLSERPCWVYKIATMAPNQLEPIFKVREFVSVKGNHWRYLH